MKNLARNLAPVPVVHENNEKYLLPQAKRPIFPRDVRRTDLPPFKRPQPAAPKALSLKNWNPDEQPRERLAKHGPEALSTSELIAILLRTGTRTANACTVARELLHAADGQLRRLGRSNWRDLEATHGVGRVKAVTLLAALELGRRQALEAPTERPRCQTSSQAYALLAPHLADLPHEECWIVLLNNARRVLGMERLSQGGLDATVVDVRSILTTALRHRATAMVLAHNHPSGQVRPSQSDIDITRSLYQAGKMLRIPLQDHLILGNHQYYSFRDRDLVLVD